MCGYVKTIVHPLVLCVVFHIGKCVTLGKYVLKLLYPIIFNISKKSFHNHYMTSCYLVGFSPKNYNIHLLKA